MGEQRRPRMTRTTSEAGRSSTRSRRTRSWSCSERTKRGSPSRRVGCSAMLGDLFYAKARYAVAERMMRRAVAIGEATLRPDDPELGDPPQQSRGSCCKTLTAPARPSRSIAALWRSRRRASVRIIPTWRSASTISRPCCKPRTASARPSRSIAARSRSTRRAYGPDHPADVGRAEPRQSRSSCCKPRTASARPSRSFAARSRIDEASLRARTMPEVAGSPHVTVRDLLRQPRAPPLTAEPLFTAYRSAERDRAGVHELGPTSQSAQ